MHIVCPGTVKIMHQFSDSGFSPVFPIYIKNMFPVFKRLSCCKVVTMPPVAAQMMMKAVDFLLLVYISFRFVVSLFWRHQYTTEHVVTPGDPEPGRLSVAAILPAQMIGAFKPVYL